MADDMIKQAKPTRRKPTVTAPGAAGLAEMPVATAGDALGELAAELPPALPETAPAQAAEFIEAIASPASMGDALSGAASSAPASEGKDDMATVATPFETVEKAQAQFGDVAQRFKTAFEKSSKAGEEMVDFAKGNMEAMMASARVAAQASETLGQEVAAFGKRHLESTTAAFKNFASVKSPTELFQLQSEYAKSSFDSAVAEASRLSESMMKLAGDIAQPLSNRYALAAEKIKSTSL